jgi:hypothetical protein
MSNLTHPFAGHHVGSATPEALHNRFLAILPRIETHAVISFRHLQCPGKREDAVAEVIALAWKWLLRLDERGKDVEAFVSTLADHAVRQVRSGRRLCGQEKAKDAMSSRAQRFKHFAVQTLPAYDTGRDQNATIDALQDNTKSPPDEQAAFRIDFAAWLQIYDDRKRRVIHDLMLGEKTLEVANRHHLSPARISQLRREFKDDWQKFYADALV